MTSVPFDTTVEILIYVFAALAMLCIGMSATLKDMLAFLREPSAAGPAIVSNIVIPPVVALSLISFIPVDKSAATVLLLLAFAPGGINAVQFSTKVPGQLAAAGALLLLLSVIGLVTAPIATGWLLPSDSLISLPAAELGFRVVGLIVAPLLIGLAIRSTAPGLAEKLYKPAMLVSTLAFIASVLLSLGVRQDARAELGTGTTIAMLAFILILMAVGWMLGGPTPEKRQVLAVTTNLRNVGLIYVLVDGCCNDSLYAAAVLAFMVLMVPANLVFTIGCAVMRKRRTG
jgi:BASS family bile acid:Na+ symporter